MKLYRSRSSYSTPRPSRGMENARYRARSHYSRTPNAKPGQESRRWIDPSERSRIRRGLPVFLAFCIVLGMVLPVFFSQIGRVTAPEGETRVRVLAAQDGSDWSGRLTFKLGGTEQWTGMSVPYEVFVHPGVYTVTMAGGGPAGTTLQRIEPAASQLGQAGGTMTFTLNFSSPATSGS